VIHVTHHAVLHHTMAHHAITIAIPPLALGVSLGLRLFSNSWQSLVWVVPVVPAPRWTSVIHVTHHAVLHHTMAHHAITIAIPPFSLRVRLFVDSWQGLVWVVPAIVTPRWASIHHVTHHALTLIAITIWIHPFAVGLGLCSIFVVSLNDNIGLIWRIPAIAPGWTSMVHVAHHAVLHHAMAHHAIPTAIGPLAL